MLTIESLKEQLTLGSHPDTLYVGVDTQNENQLYIMKNDGISNIDCKPIEQFSIGIKHCILKMIDQNKLRLSQNEKPLRIGGGRSIYSYSIYLGDAISESKSSARRMHFSSIFIRWQRTHKLSDEHAQEKLGLTQQEFSLFRKNELTITQSLIDKLSEVTKTSKQFWQNLLLQQKRIRGCDNENI